MNKPDTIAAWVGAIVILLVVFFGIIALQTWLIMLLWNFVVPALGGPALTYKLALGLFGLLSILGGFFKTFQRSK